MWKYKCKNQVLTLVIAFAAGVLLMVISLGDSSYTELITEMLTQPAAKMLQSNPWLIYAAGGLMTAGIANIFLVGNFLMSQFNISPFLWFLLMMIMPSYVIMFGVVTVPIMLVVSIYGWISLEMKNRNMLRSRKISNDDELVRIYTIHHPLMEEYRELAMDARKTIRKINWIYLLGLAAVFCVIFFIDNIFITIIAIFFYMFAFQFLSRYRQQVFAPITSLLYHDCNPAACMSALIYYSMRGKHYRLTNQALMASCLIYMDDPALAQDVLITYPRGNVNSELTYWSLMSYTYYLLKDESGLYRCKEAIEKIKPGFGAMTLMIRSAEQAAVENKIRLMDRDFGKCKQYYLDMLKNSPTRLQSADCSYYIALISFVQEDYPLAEVYFTKTIQLGNQLYFVRNARNYLAKIQEMNIDSHEELAYLPEYSSAPTQTPPAAPQNVDQEKPDNRQSDEDHNNDQNSSNSSDSISPSDSDSSMNPDHPEA